MSTVRRAVILAAGMATRLRPASDLIPKGLIEVGGTPILRRSVGLLARVGIEDILVVTGHRAPQIEEALGTAEGRSRIRYARNEAYAETGSMVSLLTALPETDGPLILLESDLLYHPAFLEIAVAAGEDVIMAADLSGSGDEVYLAVDENNLLRFLGKNPPAEWREKSLGELAGITRLGPGILAKFGERVRAMLAAGDGNHHYETVLFALAQEGSPLRVVHCPGAPWTEIDTPADLRRAEEQVWPKLRGA
jgi:L-glutamine-phosphate cytidylyltransferase